MSHAPQEIVIIGGGIAGLSSAYTLQEHAAGAGLPLACTIIEADRYWGGKILTRRVGDWIIESGPDSFLSQKPWGLELCNKLGLADQLINTNESAKKAFVYSRGRMRALPEGLVMIVPSKLGPFLRSGLLSWPGMIRMGLDLFLPARRSSEDESLAGFFRRRLGREAFERFLEPLMAGIYAGDAERMSLGATFPRFIELEQQYGSIIRGILGERNKRQAGSRPSAPSRTMFVSLREGLSDLVNALVARVQAGGVSMRLGERVDIVRLGSPRAGRRRYEVVVDSGSVLPADAVILAAPAYAAADLVRGLSTEVADLLAEIPYASTATVSLAYDRANVASAVAGFGFVVPRVERRHLRAATWTSVKWNYRAPPSQALIRCYLGGMGLDQTLDRDDGSLVQLVREELQTIAGVSAAPIHAEVHRWPRGMPQYHLGHQERLRHIEAALGEHPGLYLTGAAYRGIGVPDCIRDGTETADRVLNELTEPNP